MKKIQSANKNAGLYLTIKYLLIVPNYFFENTLLLAKEKRKYIVIMV